MAEGDLAFTGEFMVPGKTELRIERDHVERYAWAAARAAGAHVLDIACGSGYGAAMLARAGAASVDGVDINADAVGAAVARFREPNLTFICEDILRFAGRGRLYDLITCFETIEHVDDDAGALGRLRHLLSPGGTLLISSPNRPVTSPGARRLGDPPANRFHVREYRPRELRDLLARSGFDVRREVYGQRVQPFPLPAGWQRRYSRVLRPHERSSPSVRRLRYSTPRYFILVARPKRP